MKIYYGRIPRIAEDLVRTLVDAELIEVSPELVPEAQLDAESVLREYLRTERDIATRAREISDQGRGSFGAARRALSSQANFKAGDEGLDYIVNQLIETFMHSSNVEEIYADDLELRRRISDILKRHTRGLDDELDQEVRNRIKNLQEGSDAWETEYSRVLGQLKKKRNLE
jgi:uncharacterized protein